MTQYRFKTAQELIYEGFDMWMNEEKTFLEIHDHTKCIFKIHCTQMDCLGGEIASGLLKFIPHELITSDEEN